MSGSAARVKADWEPVEVAWTKLHERWREHFAERFDKGTHAQLRARLDAILAELDAAETAWRASVEAVDSISEGS